MRREAVENQEDGHQQLVQTVCGGGKSTAVNKGFFLTCSDGKPRLLFHLVYDEDE